MYAGLREAKGDIAAIMDANLQDPPSLLPKMFEIMREDCCDSVATRRKNRTGESAVRSFSQFFVAVKICGGREGLPPNQPQGN